MALWKPFALHYLARKRWRVKSRFLEFLFLTTQHCWAPSWIPWQETLNVSLCTCAWSVALPWSSSHQQPAFQYSPGCDWHPLIHQAMAWRCGLNQAGLTCVLSSFSKCRVSPGAGLLWGPLVWSQVSSSPFICPSHTQTLGPWWFSRGSRDFTWEMSFLQWEEVSIQYNSTNY